MALPKNHEPYVDKYFLRANRILKAENLNPWVQAQVFVRKGPGIIGGIDDAVEILRTYTPLEDNGGKIFTLKDGDSYQSLETLMLFEGRIQDFMEHETMYLGVLSEGMTIANGEFNLDFKSIEDRAKKVIEAADGRPCSYFGARHRHFKHDADIAAATFRGGFTSTSTDIGAALIGQKGMGTIPHALENVYAGIYGKDRAVVESTLAFDRVIDPSVPRIALVDYNNREIDDSVTTAEALEGRLYAVRLDTCGENLAQGAINDNPEQIRELFGNIDLSNVKPEHRKYWFGTGVTVSGTYAVRKALDEAGYDHVKIVATSGFGNPEKTAAFSEAARILGGRLHDMIGAGQLYHSRAATMDIVAVGDSPDTMAPMSKVGRIYRPNHRLNLQTRMVGVSQ